MAIIDELQKNYKVIKYLEDNGMTIPDELFNKKEELEKQYLDVITPMLQDYADGLFKELQCDVALLVKKEGGKDVVVTPYEQVTPVIAAPEPEQEPESIPQPAEFVRLHMFDLAFNLFNKGIKLPEKIAKNVIQILNRKTDEIFEEHVNMIYGDLKEDVKIVGLRTLTQGIIEYKMLWGIASPIVNKLRKDFEKAYHEFIILNRNGNLAQGLPTYLKEKLYLGYFRGTKDFILCKKEDLERIEKHPQTFYDDMSNVKEVEVTQETLFKKYLKEKHKTEAGIERFISAIKGDIKQFINRHIDDEADSVYSFETPDEFRNCMYTLRNIKDFKKLNDQQHNILFSCLDLYLSFLIDQNKNKE